MGMCFQHGNHGGTTCPDCEKAELLKEQNRLLKAQRYEAGYAAFKAELDSKEQKRQQEITQKIQDALAGIESLEKKFKEENRALFAEIVLLVQTNDQNAIAAPLRALLEKKLKDSRRNHFRIGDVNDFGRHLNDYIIANANKAAELVVVKAIFEEYVHKANVRIEENEAKEAAEKIEKEKAIHALAVHVAEKESIARKLSSSLEVTKKAWFCDLGCKEYTGPMGVVQRSGKNMDIQCPKCQMIYKIDISLDVNLLSLFSERRFRAYALFFGLVFGLLFLYMPGLFAYLFGALALLLFLYTILGADSRIWRAFTGGD